MSRFKIILGLILFGISLHFFASSLRFGLDLTQNISSEYAQIPHRKVNFTHSSVPTFNKVNLWTTLKKQIHHLAPRKKEPKYISISYKPAQTHVTPTLFSSSTAKVKNIPPFLQITMEDSRPPLQNKALGPEASKRLDLFLQKRRARNAELATETASLFGPNTQMEVINALVADEEETYKNACESQSAEDFAARQTKTDKNTKKKFNEIFEQNKKSFNRRLIENTSDWNHFFRQVNNFQKADD